MSITIKDLIAGMLARMAFQGGLTGSTGKIGLSTMLATGALPGKTGVAGGIGNLINRTLGGGQPPANTQSSSQIGGLLQRALSGSSQGTAAGQGQVSGAGPLQTGAQASAANPTPVKVTNWPASLSNLGQSGTTGGGGIGGLAQAGASAAKGLALEGVAGLAPWLEIVKEVAKLPFELKEWGGQLLEGQRGLGQFNGQIAQAYAQLDVSRLFRQMKTGGENSESIQFLAKQQDKLEETLRPLESAMSRTGNYVAGGLEMIGTDIADVLTMLWDGTFGAIPGLATGQYAQIKTEKDDPTTLMGLAQTVRDIAMGEFHKPAYPPLTHSIEVRNK